MITKTGDIVLIYYKNRPTNYARVEHIVIDVKPSWWQITLLLLTVPIQKLTWILKEEYIDGSEFIMGGEVMRLERLYPLYSSSPEQVNFNDFIDDNISSLTKKAKVINLTQWSKNHK